jgi:hypothetical protein
MGIFYGDFMGIFYGDFLWGFHGFMGCLEYSGIFYGIYQRTNLGIRYSLVLDSPSIGVAGIIMEYSPSIMISEPHG